MAGFLTGHGFGPVLAATEGHHGRPIMLGDAQDRDIARRGLRKTLSFWLSTLCARRGHTAVRQFSWSSALMAGSRGPLETFKRATRAAAQHHQSRHPCVAQHPSTPCVAERTER